VREVCLTQNQSADCSVIAIDNDLTRLKLARHNALQYGVADRIEFIHGSYIDWAKAYAGRADKEAIDVVFLSPPWGRCISGSS
jgi:trimethylguanosine synthase